MADALPSIPWVLAGPILRQCTPTRLVYWLAVREPALLRIRINPEVGKSRDLEMAPGEPGCRILTAGMHLHYLLIDLRFEEPLPQDCWIGYTIALQGLSAIDGVWLECADWAPDLCYPGKRSPGFVLPSRIRSLLHGSCRKPHDAGGDGLIEADQLLESLLAQDTLCTGQVPVSEAPDARPAWPSVLMMTGDQVYADDVAGPMLHAIQQVIARLGLPDEPLAGGELIGAPTAQLLYRHPAGFYRRDTLLPRQPRNYALIEVLFGGVEKPVFTTDSAHNHLISLGEVLAMYLLVWSPALWSQIDLTPPANLDAGALKLYHTERDVIQEFVAGLPAVQRLFAHLPTAMIFDDHDITDDWNLSREWEEVAYGHPFSRRVIGNAVFGYLINQAWGNHPDAFDGQLMDQVQSSLDTPGAEAHEALIDRLLRFDCWHYSWPTQPPLVVIDGRTHRWRSESAARKPSGLMDWEALTDLQQTLKGLPAVLLVSPAPIFGVKLIESIQRVFSWCGQSLLVDAENWMAHAGAGNTILNIFRHPKTPQHFVVLSGDVHYSFVYDVELRGQVRGPDIWQITSSGLRNSFPPRLLDVLDRANRWLYAPRSPLNWLTRRRHMRVIPRKPDGIPHGRRLLNGSGIGLVELDLEGVPWRIRELLSGGQIVSFSRREEESRWD
ncbi:alkaline phosphatase family protein [Azoarcus communis]|uniref:alkaline phosphatase D family protein n=1 Tax=Parazoarcus communis TaxID=41977 RepID=UPI001459692D|nr:alkaline phosphatase D family protein [Parazoarcus communis]NMG48791.1 alkaline phosphatase family protein [Parazoarcus communis]